MYFSGQGRVYIATRAANGLPAAMRWVGNVPDLKITLETEKLEHKESSSGQRQTDLSLITGKKSQRGILAGRVYFRQPGVGALWR